MIKRKGFTLIELLVVIGIIALLSTLAVVALNNARSKARDAKRIADIKQMQTALELYFNDQQGYPTTTAAVTIGTTATDCLSSASGFASDCGGVTYMGQVPSNPTPATTAATSYTYSSDGSTYNLTFGVEGQTGSLGQGTHTATNNEIK